MPVFFDFFRRQASTAHPEDGSFWRKQTGGEDSQFPGIIRFMTIKLRFVTIKLRFVTIKLRFQA
jgi:hypothetical protein